MHTIVIHRLASVFMVVVVSGCGPTSPRKYPVSGTVTYNRKPVSDGDIIFVPQNTSLAPVAGKIKDGHFTAFANEGKCRVEITALDIGPNTRIVMGSPMASNFIPAKYNEESKLSVEVSATDENVFAFKCDP